MRVVVAGGTGLIGRGLVRALLDARHAPVVLTRDPSRARGSFPRSVDLHPWLPDEPNSLTAPLDGADAVVNLAGENIGAGRWTAGRRKSILESRTGAASALAETVRRCSRPPAVFLQASAVGLYGDRGDTLLNESSGPGEGFLSEVVQAWESAALPAGTVARLAFLRFGVVLAREGGALPRMALPFRLFAGGYAGRGRQYLSWIHRDDAVRAILFLLEHPEASGPFNLTAPNPMEARLFCGLIGRVLRRWSWLPQPAWLLRLALGDMADGLLLSSQRALPRRLTEIGFEFQFPKVGLALRDLLSGSR